MATSHKNGTSTKNGARNGAAHQTSTARTRLPATGKRSVHYVLSTHWDREWHRTFQDFRRMLVHLFDRVLDDIAAGKIKGPFSTDGQAIVLDDYLEIRPERRKQVLGYVKSGKLKVGPWYVLPDEWLVSGESIVRNIRLGRQMARVYGAEPSDAGFVCDLFGHISQLPGIFKGFGIASCLLWRGIEQRESAHFQWEGADGSRVLAYRFPCNGYCDYDFDVRHAMDRNYVFTREKAVEDLRKFLAKEAARSKLPPILMFDGGDHLEYDSNHYQLLTEMKKEPNFDFDIKFSTMDGYLEEALESAGTIRDVVKGELREPGKLPANKDLQWLIPGVLSSRVWIKQANMECQTLLCNWMEPFAALASSVLAVDYPQGYLDVAWKWLLQNHPHDSICGCSIDQVHEDMKYRFSQCRQIAEEQTSESLRALAASVPGELTDKEVRVLVANPLTRPLDEPFSLKLRLPSEWATYNEFFGFEPKPAFRIYTAEGKEVPYQLVSFDPNKSRPLLRPTSLPCGLRSNDVVVSIQVPIPALGYTTLTVREGEKDAKDAWVVFPTRHPNTPGLATSERSMENETLAVTIEPNGTLTIRDKRTNETYERLLTFEDVADIGDGWYHGFPVNDQKYVSTAAHADVALVADGKSLCQFRIRTEMRVPAEFNFERRVRTEEFRTLLLDTTVSLRAGTDRVEVTTTVDNTVKDHRLRVLFPTGVNAKTFLADSAFDVVEREVALPADNHTYRELAVDATAQQSWTAVMAGKRGLAVVAKGLPESSVYDLPERPIGLTLFRATRKTVFTDGEPLGQLQQRLVFDYWIVPVSSQTERRHLCDYGTQISAGLRTATLHQPEVPIHRKKAAAPATASFLEVKGGAVTSSVRQVDGGLEVRLFNPETKKIDVTLDLSGAPGKKKAPGKVTPVDLESKAVGKAEKFNGKHKIALRAKEFVTLRFS